MTAVPMTPAQAHAQARCQSLDHPVTRQGPWLPNVQAAKGSGYRGPLVYGTGRIFGAGSRPELLAISADTHDLTGVVLPYVTDFNDVPEHAFSVDKQAAAMFEAFAAQQQISLDDFAHTTYVDAYGERRKKAIEAALAGKAVPTDAKAPPKQAVPDLMAAMSAALAGATPPAKKPARKKAVK